ncbi:MAG: phosphoglycerate mutase [Nanoarchaeota archaeon]|nr:phosphoglycerate mutase [Nanoarchaeota archaeon]MBU1103432.1 phosphoglycerate mutase [Nanoarchaeota archaeon]
MKGIFIILDGVSDLPCKILGQKTPLETAKTPNLDFLSSKGKLDYCYTVKENVAPQSQSAVVSLFGKDPNLAPRGSLEAQGAGLTLANGDLAFRTNFATIDDLNNLNIIDRRAGRTLTTKEARILAKAINEKVKLSCKFEFIPTVHHRGVLVFRGGFSDNITNLDPEYGRGIVNPNSDNKVHFSHAVDDEEDSEFSAELLNNFTRQSFKILDNHPINKKRAGKGLHAANIILSRDAGNKPVKFKKLKGKWAAFCYMPLEIGIAKSLNMDIFKFKPPKLKSMDVYANLFSGLKGFMKFSTKKLKKNKNKYDYFYIHFKKTDTPGHDNKPLEKVKMIELLDQKFFSFLKEFIGENKLIITADHTTSCEQKAHTADPVPVLTYPISGKKKNPNQRFTEQDSKTGRKILGRKLLEQNLF